MKKFLLVAICFFGNFSFVNAQYTETINSNRPGDSQGAFSVGTNVLQLETALRLGHDEHALRNTETDLFGLIYALRFGIGFERLEVNWMGSFLSSTENIPSGANEDELKIRNFEYNTLGFKYLFYDPYKKRSLEGPNIRSWKANFKFRWRDLIPAVSLYAGANFALGDSPYYIPNEPQMSPKVALITQHNFHSWVLVMNFVMDKFTTDFPTTSGIFTLTHSFNPHFAVFGEYQAIK
ncbi:MAG TPA: transporter, partial [Flavobacteriaceae bacterium]|nr:transporter [Flavobacteriaceae bacterium]